LDNNIQVSYINLAGIGLTVNAKQKHKKRKIYSLRITAILPDETVNIDLKIAIIDIKKNEKCGYSYRAVYRNLSDTQLSVLKKIAENFTKSEIISVEMS